MARAMKLLEQLPTSSQPVRSDFIAIHVLSEFTEQLEPLRLLFFLKSGIAAAVIGPPASLQYAQTGSQSVVPSCLEPRVASSGM